jgi:hypothetical protein
MTVESINPVQRYNYNGPGLYPFDFEIFSPDNLTVTYIDKEGVTTILDAGFDYDVVIEEGVIGGKIDMYLQSTDGSIDIRRRIPQVQETDWVNNNALDMNILETDFDKVVMMIQEINTIVREGVNPIYAKGEWKPNFFYETGSVVEVDESLYQAVIEHTSSDDFTNDLNAGNWMVLFNILPVKGYTERAEDAAVSAENAKNTAVSASVTAVNAKDETLPARDEAVAARNEAVPAADTAVTYGNMAKEYAIGSPPEGSAHYWAQQAGAVVAGMAKNELVNGNFDIWQKSNSQTSNGILSVDRWYFDAEGLGGKTRKIKHKEPLVSNNFDLPPLCRSGYLEDYMWLGSEVANDHCIVTSQRIPGVRRFSGERVYIQMYLKSDVPCSLAVSLDIEPNIYQPDNWIKTVGGAKIINITTPNVWEEHTVYIDIPTIDVNVDSTDCLRLKIWRSAGSDWDSQTGGLGKQPNSTVNFSAVRLYVSGFPRECEIRTVHEEEMLCKAFFYHFFDTNCIGTIHSSTNLLSQKYFHPVPMMMTPTISMTTAPNIYFDGNDIYDGLEYVRADRHGFLLNFRHTPADLGVGVFFMYGQYSVDAEYAANQGEN